MNFSQTRKSGTRFEDQIVACIGKYTNHIWQNIRIETLLTEKGNTEVDILFVYKDMVFIVEAKNVSSIFGKYNSQMWSFCGASSASDSVKEYSALNVITQNGIHIRSFVDAYNARFHTWVRAMPIIVVPNNCKIAEELQDSIYTIDRFDEELRSIASMQSEDKMYRAIAMLVEDNNMIMRADFRDIPNSSKRVKVVVTT